MVPLWFVPNRTRTFTRGTDGVRDATARAT
jgi:hypothetical protein